MITTIIDTYRKAYGGLPREVWMISIALFINRFGTMVIPFLALYLTTDLDFSESAVGSLISVYGLGSIAGTYIGGRLTRPVGAIRLQIVLFLLAVPVFLALPFCRTWASLSIAIFILSLFTDGARPANATAISDFSSRDQKTRSYALQRMAANLGVSFGPAIGGILSTISFFWLFVADAVTTLACAVTLIVFFGFAADRSFSQSGTAAELGGHSAALNKRNPLSDGLFLSFLGLQLATAIVFFQFYATYPLYLRDYYHLSRPMIGIIFSVNTIMIVVFEMVLVDRARSWSLIPTIGWGSFLSCVGFGILPLSPLVWFCVFSMVVITIGEMLSMPFSAGWVAARSEGSDTGSYMGWYTMTYSIAVVVGPALGGWIYEFNRELVWYVALVIGGLVLGGFYLLHRNERNSIS